MADRGQRVRSVGERLEAYRIPNAAAMLNHGAVCPSETKASRGEWGAVSAER